LIHYKIKQINGLLKLIGGSIGFNRTLTNAETSSATQPEKFN